MKTARILVNCPSSQGGVGDLCNFPRAPSLTLGRGSWGSNAISENVGPKHLINKKAVAKRAEVKYPIADCELTLHMAIADVNPVTNIPERLTAAGGIDAAVHSPEACVSVMAHEYGDGRALQALKPLYDHLPATHPKGAACPAKILRKRKVRPAFLRGSIFSIRTDLSIDAVGRQGSCHSPPALPPEA